MAEFHTDFVYTKQPIPFDALIWPPLHFADDQFCSDICNRQVSYNMDDLARQLAIMAVIEDHSIEEAAAAAAKQPPLLPQLLYEPFPIKRNPAVTKSYGLNMGLHVVERGWHTSHENIPNHVTPSNPIQHYSLCAPVTPQAERMIETNAVNQIPSLNIHLQSQLLPFQRAGIQFGGLIPSDCSGTGVFFPRVTSTSAASKTTNVATNKKGQRYVEIGQSPCGTNTVRLKARRETQVEYHCHPCADLGLPEEWTY